jgi:hypothetical protein
VLLIACGISAVEVRPAACRDMARKVQWEHYKREAVSQALAIAKKEHHLQQYSDLLFDKPWRP